MCSSRKYPYPPQGRSRRVIGNSKGEGVSKANNFWKESTLYMYEAKSGISRGVGVQTKKTFCGGMDIFWNHKMNFHVWVTTNQRHLMELHVLYIISKWYFSGKSSDQASLVQGMSASRVTSVYSSNQKYNRADYADMYLILTNFCVYLILRNRQIRFSWGFNFAISEVKGCKGFKILRKYCLSLFSRFFATSQKLILAKRENKWE